MDNNAAHATIEFTLDSINDVLDELSARLDAAGYPVLEANLETGTLTVDASSDPDDFSIFIAASDAGLAVGLTDEDVLFAGYAA